MFTGFYSYIAFWPLKVKIWRVIVVIKKNQVNFIDINNKYWV